MKVVQILETKHTVLSSVDGYNEHQGLVDYTQTNMKLKDILFELGHKYKNAIDRLRKLPYHSNEQKQAKLEYPVWFVGGTFPFNKTEDKDILTYSNILAIDIDKQDNIDLDIEKIREQLYKLPYVFGAFKSISGEGIYVLILVEDGRYTIDYYKYIDKLWKQMYNINIDHKCRNIGRKRFISYEDNIEKWIKSEDIDIVSWKLKYIEKEVEKKPVQTTFFSKYNSNIEYTRKAIWKLLDSGFSIDNYSKQSENYGAWYHTACEFANFEDGYDMFVKFSQNSTKYNDDINTINKKWKNADKNKTNIDDVNRKWCGMCKNKFGRCWWK